MGLRKAHGRQTDVLFVVLFPPALLQLFDLRQLSMGGQGVPNSVSLRDCDDTRWYLQMVGQNQRSWFLLAKHGQQGELCVHLGNGMCRHCLTGRRFENRLGDCCQLEGELVPTKTPPFCFLGLLFRTRALSSVPLSVEIAPQISCSEDPQCGFPRCGFSVSMVFGLAWKT